MSGKDHANQKIASDTVIFNTGLFFLCIALGIISLYLQKIEVWILQFLNKTGSREHDLIVEKQLLVDEQRSVSITDEFPRHARLQRRINKLNEELRAIRSTQQDWSRILIVKFLVRISFGFILMSLSIYYKTTPVFNIDSHYRLTPFTFLITYPLLPNEVSFHFWAFCCTSVMPIIKPWFVAT